MASTRSTGAEALVVGMRKPALLQLESLLEAEPASPRLAELD